MGRSVPGRTTRVGGRRLFGMRGLVRSWSLCSGSPIEMLPLRTFAGAKTGTAERHRRRLVAILWSRRRIVGCMWDSCCCCLKLERLRGSARGRTAPQTGSLRLWWTLSVVDSLHDRELWESWLISPLVGKVHGTGPCTSCWTSHVLLPDDTRDAALDWFAVTLMASE